MRSKCGQKLNRNLENGSAVRFIEALGLLPLNSRRRLRSNIVHDSVDILHFVYDADGNLFEDVIWDTREIDNYN